MFENEITFDLQVEAEPPSSVVATGDTEPDTVADDDESEWAIIVKSSTTEHLDRLRDVCEHTTQPSEKAFLDVILSILQRQRTTAIAEHILLICIRGEYTEMQEKVKFR